MKFISARKLGASFHYAGKGIKVAIREEQNFRLHILAAILVVLLMVFLRVSLAEAAILVGVIILVMVTEIINSILERFLDIVEPQIHPAVESVKDMMAAVVLLASLGAIITGVLIFGPPLLDFFTR